MTTVERILAEYGYLAVFVGTFFEGETILLLAGFAAHQEYLRLPLVILVALAGSFGGDQLWFHLTRRRGRGWLERRPRLAATVARGTRLLERHPTLFVLGFRFVYGLRSVAPSVIALSAVPTARFVALNAVAAALWAIVAGTAGYFFGHAVEAALGDLGRWEERALAALALAGVAIVSLRLIRARGRRRDAAGRSGPEA